MEHAYLTIIEKGFTRKEIDQTIIDLRGNMRLSDKAKSRYVNHFNPNIPEEEMLRVDDVPDTVAAAIELESKLSSAVPGLEGGWTNWTTSQIDELFEALKKKYRNRK